MEKPKMAQALDDCAARGAFKGRNAFVFGVSNASGEMIELLAARGVSAAAVLDSNPLKQGQEFMGLPVAPPQCLIDEGYGKDNSIVLVASRFFSQMSLKLRRLGYDGEIAQILGMNSSSCCSLLEKDFQAMAQRARRGYETLKRIRRRFPTRHLVVCPYGALGDMYWIMAYLPAYREKNGIKDIALVAAKGGSVEAARMFGMCGASWEELDGDELDELVQAMVFMKEGNCVIANIERPYTDVSIRILGKRLIPFIDLCRSALLGLASSAIPARPSVLEEYRGGIIVPGKTVILSPFAKSVPKLPESFWAELASRWQSKGYLVCTSISGQERPVKGTTPLSIPISQVISAVEQAGVFIALRSGLCDVAHTAKCLKTAVFPDLRYSGTPFSLAGFFALPGWEHMLAKP
jgi:hypothetical protein